MQYQQKKKAFSCSRKVLDFDLKGQRIQKLKYPKGTGHYATTHRLIDHLSIKPMTQSRKPQKDLFHEHWISFTCGLGFLLTLRICLHILQVDIKS